VIGRTHPRFWKHFSALPVAAQKLAREKYTLWKEHPHHPSLRFEERRNGICVVLTSHLRRPSSLFRLPTSDLRPLTPVPGPPPTALRLPPSSGRGRNLYVLISLLAREAKPFSCSTSFPEPLEDFASMRSSRYVAKL
jgi:hypothetical protein